MKVRGSSHERAGPQRLQASHLGIRSFSARWERLVSAAMGSLELMGATGTPQTLAKGDNPVQTLPGCGKTVLCPQNMCAR